MPQTTRATITGLAVLAGIAGASAADSPATRWRVVSVGPARIADDPAWTARIVLPQRIETGSLGPRHDRPGAPRLIGPHHHMLDGIASYYWQDQMTASGERFNKRAMTAAHKTLPLGTRVRVTRLDNGHSVVVRINDRGPYKAGRVIDLSEAAAEQIGMTRAGLTRVKVAVLD